MRDENWYWWEVEPWWMEWAVFGICAVWTYILPAFMLPMLMVSASYGKIRRRVVLPCVAIGVPLFFQRMVAVGDRVFIISTLVSAVMLIAVLILLWRDGAFKADS